MISYEFLTSGYACMVWNKFALPPLPAAQCPDAGIDGVGLGLIRHHEKLAK